MLRCRRHICGWVRELLLCSRDLYRRTSWTADYENVLQQHTSISLLTLSKVKNSLIILTRLTIVLYINDILKIITAFIFWIALFQKRDITTQWQYNNYLLNSLMKLIIYKCRINILSVLNFLCSAKRII